MGDRERDREERATARGDSELGVNCHIVIGSILSTVIPSIITNGWVDGSAACVRVSVCRHSLPVLWRR